MEEKKASRKKFIKKFAAIFLIVMLVLTFFSNTIMNYSLPEVATEPVSEGTVTKKVRVQGAVEANTDNEVTVSGMRVIKEVKFENGDKVKKGDVLFTFEEGEDSEIEEAQKQLDSMELTYAKSLLTAAPDYTEDNLGIKEAKEQLQAAVEAQEKAQKNDKELSAAKKAEEQVKQELKEAQDKADKVQEQLDAYAAIGDYDAVNEKVTTAPQTIASLKKELERLKEDLSLAQEMEGDVLSIQRSIEDKEAEIAGEEADLAKQKTLLESLKPSKDLKQQSTELGKKVTALQKDLEEKTAKVAELSSNDAVTLEQAKADVKDKQKSLSSLIRALASKKKGDALEQQSAAMDNQATQKEIEDQKKKLNKLKEHDDLNEVKAEEDGVISEISCKAGDKVSAESPLAKIQLDNSGYVVKTSVTKAQSKLLKAGDEAKVENVWGDDVTASVKSIKVDTENPNQNMIVVFEVKGDVQIGQNLALSAGEKSNRYDTIVPNNAIREDSKGKFVLILKVKGTPLGNRYTVKRADVEVEASDETSSGVSGGVVEYDNVITNSSKPLEEGMQVRLVE